MPQFIIETLIDAPAATCFGLIRDERVLFEERSTGSTVDGQNAVVEIGQAVTFEKRFLGIKQEFTVKVVELEPGRRFVDQMIRGWFKSFVHIHEFEDTDGKTLMSDTVEWTSPYGILGSFANKVLIQRYLSRLVVKRNARLQSLAQPPLTL